VYLGDDEPCDIVKKDNVVVSLFNGSTLKLRNVRHVRKVKRNLISIDSLRMEGWRPRSMVMYTRSPKVPRWWPIGKMKVFF